MQFKPYSIVLGLALLAASCTKKSGTDTASSATTTTTSSTTSSSTPTVLLTRITNATVGDTYYGKTLAEFSYTGKQLTKAVIYHYSITPDIETDVFSYNSSGQLTGSAITHTLSSSNNEVSSVVSYSGGNISEIKLYRSGNVLDADNTFTYQSGKLTNWLNPNEVSLSYSYDSNGHNTKQTAVEYASGKPDGSQSVTTNSSFDSKSNLSQSLPLWLYFRISQQEQSFSFTPGSNNPLSASDDGSSFTYSYQYDSNGYPTAISWTDGNAQAYQYSFTTIN